ncbi:MAG: pilus assembly PilX N-terminal domain-containing protein [Verrucomicrobia bacterium]|nr:pilus assembly PilX N-terminal domain-containing protein [Verrucomicrobiota bacterium]MBI3871335.1 pilus assembly PilX N-terminal domain-containing protein [Verrucomicrobiota bacterium]
MKLKLSTLQDPSQEGSALAHCLWMTMLVGMGAASLMNLSTQRVRMSHNRSDYNEAFYHAENALNWAAMRIVDNANPNGTFSYHANSLSLPYYGSFTNSASGFKDVEAVITASTNGTANVYSVRVSAQVGSRTRTLQATVRKDPPSKVFDYEYFLNNWGWWWGSSITGNGDNRSNWDFDFRYSPTVNGHVNATGEISSNGNPIDPFNAGSVPLAGLAKSDPVTYLKDGSERVRMPNLKSLTDYSNLAVSKGGTLTAGSTSISGVHTNGAQPGLYLVGTDSNPITINGPVVIPGDVIISGKLTGKGTLYVGGNLYIAGDLSYKNGPDFSSPPETMTPANRDSWVANNANKDLVAFAVRESILGGNVNSSSWKSACFDPSSYGLKNVGAEGSLGADGIEGTPDDGVPYKDTNGDGVADSAWYDADGDGVVDSNYDYNNQIKVTDTRASQIQGYPTDSSANRVTYDSVATGNYNRMDGIFYCNHALALYSSKSGFIGNGGVICRDEAMVFTGWLKFNYDSRVHSRYSADPNSYVDLGLPKANTIALLSLTETAPVAIQGASSVSVGN